MKAHGSFKHEKWDEKTVERLGDSQKLTKASVTYSYTGQIEGKSNVDYLMFYTLADDSHKERSEATYAGLFRFEGKINGKEGSIVMQDTGTFENGVATSNLVFIEGSGTGDFTDMSGTGRYRATQNEMHIEFDYLPHADYI